MPGSLNVASRGYAAERLARIVLLPPSMKKTTSILFLATALLGGCAARSSTPTARADAVRLFASGVSCDEIATKLAVDRDHARELIRTGMADLNRKFYKTR